jgi:hypothetical protein
MKKLVLVMVIIICSACAGDTTKSDMQEFKLDQRMDIDEVGITFKFIEDDDYLRVVFEKKWRDNPDGDVHYEASVYDGNKNLIGTVSRDTKQKYAGTVITYFKDIKKANIDRAAFFSFKITG